MHRRPRLAIRCDGGATLGAGHVARCRPVATAFADAGWEVTFVGRIEGFARWLVDEAGLPVSAPSPAPAPCGVAVDRFDAAIVDLYDADVCPLAEALPVATPGEAARCAAAGVHVDYHLDRAQAPDGPRLLSGPRYAPVHPAFVGARRPRDRVEHVLVTLGGSDAASTLGGPVAAAAARAFPDAAILAAHGIPVPPGTRVAPLPQPATLVEPARTADVAVAAAGMTAYELACAGVPMVAVVIADNQRRVGAALASGGIAPVVDGRDGVDATALHAALARLRGAEVRARQAAAGMAAVDGDGARRIAVALQERWGIRP